MTAAIRRTDHAPRRFRFAIEDLICHMSERQQSEAVAGPRCHHDMIEAWCSWCRGLDESDIAFDIIGKGE